MLEQRAGEAAALLTNVTAQHESAAKALAAVALATDGDPQRFAGAATRDPALANGGAAALVLESQGR